MTTLCMEVQHGTAEYEETVALRQHILREPLGLRFTSKELAEESDSYHIACWCDGSLVGCLVLKPLSGRCLRMRQLAIHADWQRRGMGALLVEYCERLARASGYDEIVLHARQTAVDFYRKAGYTVEGERFVEVTIPHLTMRKSLPPPEPGGAQ